MTGLMGIDGTISFSCPLVPVDLFLIGDTDDHSVSAIRCEPYVDNGQVKAASTSLILHSSNPVMLSHVADPEWHFYSGLTICHRERIRFLKIHASTISQNRQTGVNQSSHGPYRSPRSSPRLIIVFSCLTFSGRRWRSRLHSSSNSTTAASSGSPSCIPLAQSIQSGRDLGRLRSSPKNAPLNALR
jgi:hypothetical protein